MSNDWYCLIDQTTYGPLAAQDLKQMSENGKLRPTDLVKKTQTGKWIHASSVKGLVFKSAAPVDLPLVQPVTHLPAVPDPEPLQASLVESVALPPRTKNCRFCGEEIRLTATKCKHCGEWLKRSSNTAFAPQGEIKVVPVANAVIFVILTFGIYHLFWLGRIFTELHSRRATTITPGKAVGFLFIPFFNLVWVFMVWKEIGDAISRQYVSAGLRPPGTAVVWLAPVSLILGLVLNIAAPPLGSVIILILLPISMGLAQSWMNELATIPVGSFQEEEPPRRQRRRRDEDDDEVEEGERPRSRRRHREDDDEEEDEPLRSRRR